MGCREGGVDPGEHQPIIYTVREMIHQFNDAGAKALVVLSDLLSTVENVVPETEIEQVIVTHANDLMSPQALSESLLPKTISMTEALCRGAKRVLLPTKPQRGDIFVLQYTGGTTGVSKGAMLTHGNLLANTSQVRAAMERLEEGKETVIAPLPLYHIYAFNNHLATLLFQGAHTILIPNPRDTAGLIRILQKYPFSGFTGINTLFVALCQSDAFKALDFSKLKYTFSGGTALTLDVARRWSAIMGCDICEGYGLTETSPVVTVNRPDAIQLGTIGEPLIETQVKVIDDKGQTLPSGEAGELCVKGPQVMKGYWQRPEATAEVLGDDGWLKTGDFAVIQPDGFIQIVDRKKDMILVSGFNVYPNEIEDVACTHPNVMECAAIGIPDDKSGEAIRLFVVASKAGLTEDELQNYYRQHLTAYKVPKVIEFRKELPKSNVGKILRRQLREL